ncbi:MAG: succinylglutamate desuccinylase/aspartoacylase family protein [Tatlockia sp.]|nr:succinylglutamate desuccinylase/aspartoacylase family protein [Tatlockia sp.]
MKNSTLKICDATIQPGETANLALPLPDFNSCLSFYMPIKIVHGKQNGPCLLIFSGIEGNEFNGIEIINRLLKNSSINSLNGTLIAIPIINVLGLINSNSLPYDKKIEDCFPGREHGSYGERIAKIFTQEIFSKTTHCIELKTGGLNNDILPQIYCDVSNDETKNLAKRFATPVISNIGESNSLRETAKDLNIPLLVYKAGEAMRFDESSIKIGMAGVLNILTALNMIDDKEADPIQMVKPVFTQEQDWARCSRSGILVSHVTLGQFVNKNEVIGEISDPFNANLTEPVKAFRDGIIVGVNKNPLIFEGQNIFKIASFIDNNRAELSLEQWTLLQSEES